MKKVSNLMMFVLGLAQIVLGVCIAFASESIIETIFKIVGGAFLAVGVIQLIVTLLKKEIKNYAEINIVSSALNIVIGIILITTSKLVLGIITVIIGIWVMINGVLQISSAVSIKRLGLKYWPIVLILGIAVTILGYLLVTASEQTIASIVNVYIGVGLTLNGIGTILTAFFTRKEIDVKVEINEETYKIEE
ncbi:MAG: hypothetical protein E7311_02080 [Clostridiales bacterium]|nr:hypothetical protein [Clostridiales bacterium]